MIKNRNEVWLTPKEAADRLGISTSRVYHLKNSLTHRKGGSKKARVFFLESTLFEDYLNA